MMGLVKLKERAKLDLCCKMLSDDVPCKVYIGVMEAMVLSYDLTAVMSTDATRHTRRLFYHL